MNSIKPKLLVLAGSLLAFSSAQAQTFTQGNTTATNFYAFDLYDGDPDQLTGATLCLSFTVTAGWQADNHCGFEDLLKERDVDNLYVGFGDNEAVDYKSAVYNRETGIFSTQTNSLEEGTVYFDPRNGEWGKEEPEAFTHTDECGPINIEGQTGVQFSASNALIGGQVATDVVAGSWQTTVYPLGDPSGPNWTMGTVTATYDVEIDIAAYENLIGSGLSFIDLDSWVFSQATGSSPEFGFGWDEITMSDVSVGVKYIPEPSGVLLTILGAGMMGLRRKR